MVDARPNTAPGQLGLVQSFLNTYDLESGSDLLVERTSAKTWLVSHKLASVGSDYDEGDLARLSEVRSALHDLVAASDGAGLQRRAVTTLNEAARRVRLGVRLHPTDGYRLVAEGVGVDRPIGELLMSVTAAMTVGNWNRLKICSNDGCQRAFYDSSRNRSARWCSMATCGNRMKGRAYRQRHGTSGAGRPRAASHLRDEAAS